MKHSLETWKFIDLPAKLHLAYHDSTVCLEVIPFIFKDTNKLKVWEKTFMKSVTKDSRVSFITTRPNRLEDNFMRNQRTII
jgi:hypothetical protein